MIVAWLETLKKQGRIKDYIIDQVNKEVTGETILFQIIPVYHPRHIKIAFGLDLEDNKKELKKIEKELGI